MKCLWMEAFGVYSALNQFRYPRLSECTQDPFFSLTCWLFVGREISMAYKVLFKNYSLEWYSPVGGTYHPQDCTI